MGHAGVAQHLFRFQLPPTPLCDCGEIESIKHYLIDCKLHEISRNVLIKSLENIECDLTVKLLLGGVLQLT